MDHHDQMQSQQEWELRHAIGVAVGRLPAGTQPPAASRDCGHCGEPIQPKRLRALPGVRLCLDCQTEREPGR